MKILIFFKFLLNLAIPNELDGTIVDTYWVKKTTASKFVISLIRYKLKLVIN